MIRDVYGISSAPVNLIFGLNSGMQAGLMIQELTGRAQALAQAQHRFACVVNASLTWRTQTSTMVSESFRGSDKTSRAKRSRRG